MVECRPWFNILVHGDKSRDYTIADTGLLSVPQAPGMPTASPTRQANPQQASMGAWDPNMPGIKPGFPPAPGTYLGQAYAPSSSMPMYPTSGAPAASADSLQASSQQMSPYFSIPLNARPSGGSPPIIGEPPMYY